MKIDNNPIEIEAMQAYKDGDVKRYREIEDKFIRAYKEEYAEKDHCSCKEPCRWHGNCEICVAIHRAHMDHIPACLNGIFNDLIRQLSAKTEGTAFKNED